MGVYFENEFGKIEITNDCIATIIGLSCMESYGVVGMVSKSVADGIVTLLGRENLQKGIKVMAENGIVNVDIHIIVEYGTRIPVVAENIRERVSYAIGKYTGLKPGTINIFVDGIRL
ncbi:putative alkaline shock family protein YloU [Caldicellulosiruptor bescii]|uniref:Asp23/Gls24 family envelope stress response protein n=3 Tax=Caldicellulosiruptor bescii TaxID=31899 RepID=B9MRL8_CALBD|nr:Asp23/Gls24 family envelope stress response protein [Caldicellulosiruptor bescii]ACM60322.1 protein of unknown function DUF322 [Caldicellulosiruptor bescii DSM 6725]PBC87736.1 putative alkaline shock family protein YloU [Caldicellulosiruptor bescii]PBC90669.1 putative alkaline shock family protein YloU [Caldicellulosiruptor bescii]PBD03899.1 putative alkaline shock family protein YloU [Caldicellulosiruptor bescii]PBD06466.1 putative alkaline shock family protein YloU [Caldicellulosiruptor b